MTPKFDDWVRKRKQRPDGPGVTDQDGRELSSLIAQLPNAHWFLLADLGEHSENYRKKSADFKVKLLVLIPKYSQTNRMTLNALMLSLGPSLNVPGGILTELLERRLELFSTPPALDSVAPDLIDFGDVDIDIATPSLSSLPHVSRSATQVSRQSAENVQTIPLKDNERDVVKKKPSLPKKPSLTRLFGSFSATSSGSTESSSVIRKANDTPSGNGTPVLSVNTYSPPPRVDVPLALTSPLPTFENDLPSEVKPSATVDSVADFTEELAVRDGGSPDQTSEPPCTPSTPTPIADRFSTAGSVFPSLRQPKFSTTSASSSVSGSEASNPASIRRRGGPGFFSSSNEMDRTSRSHSSQSVVTTSVTGLKRKDEEEDSIGAEEEGRVKRLSAGPGVLV